MSDWASGDFRREANAGGSASMFAEHRSQAPLLPFV